MRCVACRVTFCADFYRNVVETVRPMQPSKADLKIRRRFDLNPREHLSAFLHTVRGYRRRINGYLGGIEAGRSEVREGGECGPATVEQRASGNQTLRRH